MAIDLRRHVRHIRTLTTHAGRATLPVIRRRTRRLAAIVICTGFVALVGGGLAGLLFAAGFVTTMWFCLALWTALASAGLILVVLVDLRPPRRIALPVVLAVALVLLCGVPVGWFATFAVRYGPDGGATPGAAITSYFLTGPMSGYGGYGRAEDTLEFDRVLCHERRDELHAQASRMADDLNQPTVLQIVPSQDHATVDGDHSTVITQVSVSFSGDPGNTITFRSHVVPWTFHLVLDDGWRVCQVDAPPICGTLINCAGSTPTPAPTSLPTPASSSSSADPLDGARGMLPCGPRDPFRKMRRQGDCPEPIPTSS